MVKPILSLVTASMIFAGAGAAYGQCTPSAAATSDGFRAPDNSLYMPEGNISTAYAQAITVNVPDTAIVFGTPIPVDSLRLTSVTNLAPGLSSAANKTTWLGGEKGCIQISGTPTTFWDDTIRIAYTAYVTVFGSPQPAPLNWDSIRLRINDPAGINELDRSHFSMTQNYPNPVAASTEIYFNSPAAANITFQVYNMLGKTVYRRVLKASPGVNTVTFVAGSLIPGIYVYTLSDGEKALTRRMVLAGK